MTQPAYYLALEIQVIRGSDRLPPRQDEVIEKIKSTARELGIVQKFEGTGGLTSDDVHRCGLILQSADDNVDPILQERIGERLNQYLHLQRNELHLRKYKLYTLHQIG